MAYNGGIFEATKFTTPCEVSRQTLSSYLDILEETFVVHVIRPFSTHKATEIVSVPKIYGFDTGFGCYAKGWNKLRHEDYGLLWERCVLNEIQGHLQTDSIYYWRDKKGHEIDFVLPNRSNDSFNVIECKFSSLHADSGQSMKNSIGRNIEAFREYYPNGENFVVSSDTIESFERSYSNIKINFVNPKELIKKIR